MFLNKKQGQFLTETIDHWVAQEALSPEVAERLKGSYTVRPFDWKRLAMYSFWIAMACGIIAFGAIVADDWLASLSDMAICGGAALAATGVYFLGLRQRRRHPRKVFSSEAIMFVGVLFTSAAIGFMGKAMDNGSGHFSLLFLLSTAIFAALGLWFPSKLIWVFSLLSLGSWFGTETGYVSGWGAYYLGMNFPLRFVLFGVALVALAFVFRRVPRLAEFFKPTYVLGLLNLFIALWIMSIFGNYGDMHDWERASSLSLLHWSLLFAAAAIAAIVWGLKADDATARGFGITFLFINLYTRYFEYFWDFSHKAVFFLVMGVSFFLIGRKAEAIWNLEFLGKDRKSIGGPE